FIPDSADDIGALPNSSPKLTYISSTGIYTGTVFATLIMGEEFTALNNIKIGSQTDTSAGKGLYFNNDSHIITGGGTVSMGITTPRGLSLNIGSGYDLSMYSGGLNMVLGDRFTLASWSSNDCTVGNYGSGKLTLKSNSGDMSLDCGGNLNIGTVFTDGIGFFGHSPSPKLSAQRLPSNATLSDIIFKINGLLAKFDQYGLLYVYD
ncbi:MAG: hypothetical protein N2317_08530, partial [Syntrophales bacterium]|nr:hypothetical protein [Syntrophales bacterium]